MSERSSTPRPELPAKRGSAPAPTTPSLARRVFGLELLDNRYAALHGLRVLAIVSVVQFHVTWIFAGEQGLWIDNEWVMSSLTVFFGMDLFFMLSGFLIGSILLHSLETQGKQQLRRFYLRRVFRTFPSYYLVLALLVATTALTKEQRAHLPYEIAYLTNFVPLGREDVVMFWGWSLALEEQFYLTVPVLFVVLQYLRSDRLRVGLLVALWSAALIVRLVLYFRYRPWNDLVLYSTLYFRTKTRFDTLVAGVLLAVVQRRWRRELTAWLARPYTRALVMLPTLGCLWLLLRPWMFGEDQVQLVHVFAWGSVTTLMYFGWLLILLNCEGPVHRFLSHPLFRNIATLGYGVYLVHIPLCDRVLVPAARALQHRHVTMWLIWPASLLALMLGSLAVGYLLHIAVEKPSLKVRDRLAA